MQELLIQTAYLIVQLNESGKEKDKTIQALQAELSKVKPEEKK